MSYSSPGVIVVIYIFVAVLRKHLYTSPSWCFGLPMKDVGCNTAHKIVAGNYCCYDHRCLATTEPTPFYCVLGGLSGRCFLTSAAQSIDSHLNAASIDCMNARRVSPVSHTACLPAHIRFPTPHSLTKTALSWRQWQFSHCTKWDRHDNLT